MCVVRHLKPYVSRPKRVLINFRPDCRRRRVSPNETADPRPSKRPRGTLQNGSRARPKPTIFRSGRFFDGCRVETRTVHTSVYCGRVFMHAL